MRVIIKYENDKDIKDNIEVFGSMTALNEKYPHLKPSAVQKNLVGKGFYFRGGSIIVRRDLKKKKRI